MWILFTVPTPTPDGRSARDLYDVRVRAITPTMQASARSHGCRFHQAWYADDGSALYALAQWESLEGARAFLAEWDIADEPGETAVVLKGHVGTAPLPVGPEEAEAASRR
jgi:hypothetical protein